MNTRMIRRLFSLSLLSVALTTIATAAPQIVTGVVSDDMCKQKHMMPGHTDADCTRACVNSGSRYALIVGNKVYVLKGYPREMGQFAGKRVTVTGDVAGTDLQVSSISDAK